MLLFRILPLDAASALGGWIGRTLGMRLGVTKRAYRHLEIVFPGMDIAQKRVIVTAMWDNLGRVIGEYPHLETIGKTRIHVTDETIPRQIIAQGQGGVFISAHIGNWETHVPAMLARYGVAACLTYRGLNNKYADKILRDYRTLHGKIKAFPKTRESGKHLINEVKNKSYLAILIDQKYNEGVAVPFFGRMAMTTPIFVQLCQKYKCPLVMVRCKRLKGANFELTPYAPLKLFDENGKNLSTEAVIAQAHAILEDWIRDTPEQWLWLHRRWDSAKLKNAA